MSCYQLCKDNRFSHVQSVSYTAFELALISDRYTLHIQDVNPLSVSANGWLEDTSKVEKYVMSEDSYNKREGTYRKYKEMKLKVSAKPTLSNA